MTATSKNQPAKAAETELKSYADHVVSCIQQLRHEQNIADTEPISVYITNTEVVRSLMKQYRDYIEEQTNSSDLVQVNDDAGNPMPENLPKTTFQIGDQEVDIAVEQG